MLKAANINFVKLAHEICEQHNVIRTNPQSYIPHLEEHMKYFKGTIIERPDLECGIQTNEGKDAYEECIEFLKRQHPVSELIIDQELSRACADHVNDIGPKGICDHTGTNGSTVDTRVAKYLDWNVVLTENLDFASYTAVDILVSLIVDDGVAERGHRQNVFNPRIKYIGASVGSHAIFDIMAVMDYSGQIISYHKDKDTSATKKSPEEEKQSRLANLVSLINSREKLKHLQLHSEKPADHPILNYFNTVDNQGGILRNYDNSELLHKDSDAPKNAIQVSTSVTTKRIGKKTEKKTVKTYTLDDGTIETLVLEEIIE